MPSEGIAPGDYSIEIQNAAGPAGLLGSDEITVIVGARSVYLPLINK